MQTTYVHYLFITMYFFCINISQMHIILIDTNAAFLYIFPKLVYVSIIIVLLISLHWNCRRLLFVKRLHRWGTRGYPQSLFWSYKQDMSKNYCYIFASKVCYWLSTRNRIINLSTFMKHTSSNILGTYILNFFTNQLNFQQSYEQTRTTGTKCGRWFNLFPGDKKNLLTENRNMKTKI